MKIIVEGLKSHQGLHQEQRPVHGAHGTHMQRFWVGGANTPEEHTEHAKLHEKAATEHAALAKKHGAGLYPDHMPGADPTHAIAAELAVNPHWDPDRGDAHKTLAALHRQAAGMSLGLARRAQTGLPTAHQEHHLATVREGIDDQTFYARPSEEVADDLYYQRDGEDRDAYERERDDGTPFDVGHPAARLERLKSQMAFSFAGDAGARGLHLEQKQVGGHTQGVWVKSKDASHGDFKDFGHDPHGTHKAASAAMEHHRNNASAVGATPTGNASYTTEDRDGNRFRAFVRGPSGGPSTWADRLHTGPWDEKDPWDEGPQGGPKRPWDSRRHGDAAAHHAARAKAHTEKSWGETGDARKEEERKAGVHAGAAYFHKAAANAMMDEPDAQKRAAARHEALDATARANAK